MLNITQNGSTIGERGSWDGEIIRDVEHPQGARLTLEKITGCCVNSTKYCCLKLGGLHFVFPQSMAFFLGQS